jgi:hypothetical protein
MPKIYGFLFLILMTLGSSPLLAQQKILFFQTDWGNQLPMDGFLAKVKADGYDGVEVWMPGSQEAKSQLKQGLEKHRLKVIFLHGTNNGLPYQESLEAYKNGLEEILKWNPVKVNSHTGNDFWTLEQNLAFLEAGEKIAAEAGIPLVHETHRARFSYTLPATLEMLEDFPGLKLTLDISHWMVVHERLISQEDPFLQRILPAVQHIHARVGFAEGPQINNPAAPEWADALGVHLDIWEKIIRDSKEGVLTITTEFGPPPYLPTVPFTNEPIADQWAANVYIMNAIKARL